MSHFFSKTTFISLLITIFIIGGAALCWLAWHETQTIDEGVHISAGYSYLKTGDYRLNPEHPPLAKQIAALPILFLKPTLPTNTEAWDTADQWQFAQEFLYKSGNNSQLILFLGRLPIIFLTILLGVCIARWAYELGGKISSLVATILYFSSPVILTHGHLITTDVPVALGVFATAYFFTKALRSPKKLWIFLTAFAYAFAIDVKFTGVILVVFIPLIYWIVSYYCTSRFTHLKFSHFIKLFSAMIIFGALLAFITTGCQTLKSVDDPFLGTHHIQLATEFIGKLPENTHWAINTYLWILNNVTFPGYPYVTGLFEFMTHFESGHESYFLGTYTDFGNIWYFPVAILIKTRLAVMVLLSLILTLFVKQSFWVWKFKLQKKSFLKKITEWLKTFNPESFVLFLIPTIFFLSALQSKVNIGVRHILLVYPFMFIGISMLWSIQIKKRRVFIGIITSILGIAILSTIMIWPFPMAYFSEAVGGASQGYKYMLDSNLDWGQNLPYVKEYLTKNKINTICLGYFGQGHFSSETISVKPLYDDATIKKHEPINCVVVISAQMLYNRDNTFTWLKKLQPTEVIGYGLYVYDLRTNATR
ncbi:MAG: glycosyltransferase family 39 protein [Patescibacteria group bacterium]|jgi:hypothetical protein